MENRQKRTRIWMLSYLPLLILLHFNAILKAEDPVADAQTDPILYDQKMEQEKDGVKGPATPKMVYYGGQGFLTKKTLSKYEKEDRVSSKKKDDFNWSEWWEEKPAETAASPEKAEVAASDALPAQLENTVEAVVPEPVPDASSQPLPQENPPALSQPPSPEGDVPSGDDWW